MKRPLPIPQAEIPGAAECFNLVGERIRQPEPKPEPAPEPTPQPAPASAPAIAANLELAL